MQVLVVDDEASLRRTAARILTLADHSVTLAASASEALLHLARGSFDVILCDVHMPGLDGPSFAGKLAPLDSAKVVFITGGGWGDVEKDILATRPVLRKPFCRDEMLAVMVAVAAA